MTNSPLPFADEPVLAAVAAYWAAKRGARRMADRADIDPLDLPGNVWPSILIAEPVPGTSSVRYRLVGSAHVQRYGFDFTGKSSAEVMQGDYRAHIEAAYGEAFDKAVPVYSESVFRWENGGYAFTRRLMLPLSRDGSGETPALVLSAQVWPSKLPLEPHPIPWVANHGGFVDGRYEAVDPARF